MGEVESAAVDKAKARKVRRGSEEEKEKGKEKGKEHTDNSNINRARAIFDEHGSRDMESAFLEAILKRQENGILKMCKAGIESVEEAKKVSEVAQLDKDYTQIAIQNSLKEIVSHNDNEKNRRNRRRQN